MEYRHEEKNFRANTTNISPVLMAIALLQSNPENKKEVDERTFSACKILYGADDESGSKHTIITTVAAFINVMSSVITQCLQELGQKFAYDTIMASLQVTANALADEGMDLGLDGGVIDMNEFIDGMVKDVAHKSGLKTEDDVKTQ